MGSCSWMGAKIMNETQSVLEKLFCKASTALSMAASPGDVEPEMAEFLHLVRAHPEARTFVVELFKRSLGKPGGPWEFIQFCLHGLRWPEMYEFLQAARAKDINNMRARPVWEHLLSAFDDDWEDAEFYKEYTVNK